ncbi:GPW/gp25 family protein [Ruminococcus sp.]|uniref:GPW/gp25 family protein n=1 Tax=Ruminococcus sp. TaxID=41978 RepID=UPI001B69C8D6|nr:GPW/gp25 family protein [Ruminococcus sp.]MBP5433651.1 GPW/gp25 family protein [Ruminococcus sp.]
MTNSLAFPVMFNTANNGVAVYEGNKSVVNRTRLLFLTEPTELYNAPTFGVGLKRYLFQYNNENTKAMIQDRMKEQLSLYEPCCDAQATEFSDGLLFTGSGNKMTQDFNRLEMTVALHTVFGDTAVVDFTDLQAIIDHANS